MEAKLVFEERVEVYFLGTITSPGFHHQKEKGKVYLFYCRSPLYKYRHPDRTSIVATRGFVLEERCGFAPPHNYSHSNPDFQSHSMLWWDKRYSDIVRRRNKNGKFKRFMEARTGEGDYEKRPYALKGWDKRILQRCAQLPSHVREVMGI